MSPLSVASLSSTVRSSRLDGTLQDFDAVGAYSSIRRNGIGQYSVKCRVCLEVFVFEATAVKPNPDTVCFYCLLKKKPTRGSNKDDFEEVWPNDESDVSSYNSSLPSLNSSQISTQQSSCDSQSRKKVSKQVRFKIGGLIFYPGRADLPKVKSRIFRCHDCGGSVNIIRSALSPSTRMKKLGGPMRVAKSRASSKVLLCQHCTKKSPSWSWNALGRIVFSSFENFVSPMFWFVINIFMLWKE